MHTTTVMVNVDITVKMRHPEPTAPIDALEQTARQVAYSAGGTLNNWDYRVFKQCAE